MNGNLSSSHVFSLSVSLFLSEWLSLLTFFLTVQKTQVLVQSHGAARGVAARGWTRTAVKDKWLYGRSGTWSLSAVSRSTTYWMIVMSPVSVTLSWRRPVKWWAWSWRTILPLSTVSTLSHCFDMANRNHNRWVCYGFYTGLYDYFGHLRKSADHLLL